MSPPGAAISCLIVEESAFAQKALRELLLAAGGVEVVGMAGSAGEALEMIRRLAPDVVVCDFHLAGMGGLDFVRKQMRDRARPILLVSSGDESPRDVFAALDAGAVNVVRKPAAGDGGDPRALGQELVDNVRAAARLAAGDLLKSGSVPPPPTAQVDAVVVGLSTGGPQALRSLLPLLPGNFPVPIVIVMHMPAGFTDLLAQKLDELCSLRVKEAVDGDALRPGLVLLAPAGRHLVLRRDDQGGVVARLSVHPTEKINRPSVDVLFQSAAETYGRRVLGVVMTGMGDDGREGAALIKAEGGMILTESPKSCVMYEMPRSVVEAGLSDAAPTLDEMAPAILSRL